MATAKTTRAASVGTAKTEAVDVSAENTDVMAESVPVKERFIPKDIPLNTIVTVRNGAQGRLVYKSPKTGETFRWEEFGDEQDMELGELRNAKGANKKFFQKNWFMFDEPWIIDYLGVGQFYKNALRIDEFDELFELSPDEIIKRLDGVSDGQKRAIGYRARMLIAEDGIDSNKVIAALEKALGTQLVDRG